jgi:hypothetical protein
VPRKDFCDADEYLHYLRSARCWTHKQPTERMPALLLRYEKHVLIAITKDKVDVVLTMLQLYCVDTTVVRCGCSS